MHDLLFSIQKWQSIQCLKHEQKTNIKRLDHDRNLYYIDLYDIDDIDSYFTIRHKQFAYSFTLGFAEYLLQAEEQDLRLYVDVLTLSYLGL